MNDTLFDAARESLGTYPQATLRDGEWVKRTEWQEGWNACLFRLFEHYAALRTWSVALPSPALVALIELLKADVLFLKVSGDGAVTCYVPMNDVFGYATADAEEAAPDEFPSLLSLWQSYNWDGLIAWAARKSGYEPIKERQTAGYQTALDWMRERP